MASAGVRDEFSSEAVLYASEASSMTTAEGSCDPLLVHFWSLWQSLQLMLHEDGLSCPASGGRKPFFTLHWASSVPGISLLSSAILSTTRIVWAILARC